MTIAALFILVFFCVYAASCFVTVGKLFSTLFGVKYVYMMIAGAIFVVLYTFIGGFLAESASDFMQGVVMFIALSVVLVTGVSVAGGISNVVDNAKKHSGFFEFFGIAKPALENGNRLLKTASRCLTLPEATAS
jgi:sodium/proline symporter